MDNNPKPAVKHCPECRRVLIKAADLVGIRGSFETKCANCKNLIKVQVGQRTYINVFKVIMVVTLAVTTLQIFILKSIGENLAYLINNYVPIIK